MRWSAHRSPMVGSVCRRHAGDLLLRSEAIFGALAGRWTGVAAAQVALRTIEFEGRMIYHAH